MTGKRKLIGFLALLAVIPIIHIYGGDTANGTIETLFNLFIVFVGGNLGEHVKDYILTKNQGQGQ